MSASIKSKKLKLEIRESKKTQKKGNKKILNMLVKQNEKLSDDEISKLALFLYKKKNKESIDNIKLKALKIILDSRQINTQSIFGKYKFYPDQYDKNFNELIFYKKEFHITKEPKIDNSLSIEDLTKNLCKFKLSNNQKFLKTYISQSTPYNGILLFHGTGVGKTCSSISIAENFKETIRETNRKIVILLNPSIKDNFIKNIFNIELLKYSKATEQCTKDSYLKEANIKIEKKLTKDNYELIQKKVMSIIKERYSFFGYTEFSNLIERIELKLYKNFDTKLVPELLRKEIHRRFSNSVMIIDEVHNIKETSESKVLPDILKSVLEYTINLKLVLLSATPMFDKSIEIIDLINLLLLNDKRPIIEKRDIFHSDGNIKEDGKKILIDKARGYISYLRGEHPAKFPLRLYPDVYNDKRIIERFPSRDMKNNLITEDMKIKYLKLVGCEMKDYQLQKYNQFDSSQSEDEYGAFNSDAMMASNIVFPYEDERVKNLVSKNGFSNLLSYSDKRGLSFKKEEYKRYFEKQNIGKYSCKLHNILKTIEKSKGIVFIYSKFIYGGVLPLALMLEMNGYSKFDGSLLKGKKQNPDDKKYIIISGDTNLSKNTYKKYLKIEENNKNGELVKVIIGSETAAEGLDFKYLREVHILDPWHHFNKQEQIIGRAIRNCSHKNLPFEERNVLVFLYVAIKPSNDTETIDLKMYRTAEKKMKQIAEIEYLLKINAVDCNLNLENNRFIDDIYKKKYDVVTSQSTRHKLSLNDIDNSKVCNFKECNFKCIPDLSKFNKAKVDSSTLKYTSIKDTIFDIKLMIKNLFKMDFVYNLNQIKDNYINSKYNVENLDLLYYSLNELVRDQEKFKDMYSREGILIRKNDKFIFKPLEFSQQDISTNDIRIPYTKKIRMIDITEGNFPKRSIILKSTETDNILNYVKKIFNIKRNSITKLTTNESLQKFKEDLHFYEIDYLESKKNELIEYIILKIKASGKINILELEDIKLQSTDDESSLFETGIKNRLLQTNILLNKRDINPNSSEPESIWGYKYVENKNLKYVKYSNMEFVHASKEEIKTILKTLQRKINKETASFIFAYLEYKGSSIELKIKEKTKEGSKGQFIKTGSVCGNEGMKKDKIIKFIHKTDMKNPRIDFDVDTGKYSDLSKKDLPSKPSLCNELEIKLRTLNTDKIKWFYTAEEALEREVNKKTFMY